MLEQLRIQAAMGVVGGTLEPDVNFVKHVSLGVKMVEAKVVGGRALFMFFLYENNYHLKASLERQVEIDGLGEFFAVPCKYFSRKVSMIIIVCVLLISTKIIMCIRF